MLRWLAAGSVTLVVVVLASLKTGSGVFNIECCSTFVRGCSPLRGVFGTSAIREVVLTIIYLPSAIIEHKVSSGY